MHRDVSEMSISLSISYAFHDCRCAPPQGRCFPKFRHTNWSRMVTAFQMLSGANGIILLQQLVHACPGPFVPGKVSQHTPWAPLVVTAAWPAFTPILVFLSPRNPIWKIAYGGSLWGLGTPTIFVTTPYSRTSLRGWPRKFYVCM